MSAPTAVPAHVLDAYSATDAAIHELSGGRTNRTMRVHTAHELVLQHVRAVPSSDLLQIMENLVRVASHLDWRHRMSPERSAPSGSTWWPELVPTVAGKPFIMDEHGSVWRAFSYRPGRVARGVQSGATLISAARLFGQFSGQTGDLDDPPLFVSTTGFHDLDQVWAGFVGCCDAARGEADPVVGQLEPRLSQLDELRRRLDKLTSDDGLDSVRTRVVHNDTKLSNVLLHPTADEAIAVLDFDLVMPGPIWHDVGDFLRSAAWHLSFDGPVVDAALQARLIEAWVDAAGAGVSAAEIITLATAGPRLAFELGVRYLSDALRAEPVLRVDGPGGHLRRGLANVKLASEMLEAYDALRPRVEDIAALR